MVSERSLIADGTSDVENSDSVLFTSDTPPFSYSDQNLSASAAVVLDTSQNQLTIDVSSEAHVAPTAELLDFTALPPSTFLSSPYRWCVLEILDFLQPHLPLFRGGKSSLSYSVTVEIDVPDVGAAVTPLLFQGEGWWDIESQMLGRQPYLEVNRIGWLLPGDRLTATVATTVDPSVAVNGGVSGSASWCGNPSTTVSATLPLVTESAESRQLSLSVLAPSSP